MKKLKRKDKIRLEKVGQSYYTLSDREGNVYFGSGEKYSVYFEMVTFEAEGKMRGFYLGDNPEAIIDEHSKKVDYVNGTGWVNEDNRVIKTAKLVAVQNGTGAVIIIQK